MQSMATQTTALDADRRAERSRNWIFSSERTTPQRYTRPLRAGGHMHAGVWDTFPRFVPTQYRLSGENHPVMSTEEPPAASNSLMESHAAAPAAVEAAVDSIESGDESL